MQVAGRVINKILDILFGDGYVRAVLVLSIARMQSAKEERNMRWQNNSLIPSWVDINNVDLDQFFTKKEVAKNYMVSFLNIYIMTEGLPSLTSRYGSKIVLIEISKLFSSTTNQRIRRLKY